jgi:uncharacterized protein YjdB
VWYTSATTASRLSWSSSSFSSLATYNGLLYYNTATEIRSYNPATRTDARVVAPANLGGSGTRYIYGMTMNGRAISYTIKDRAASAGSVTRRNVPAAAATSVSLNTSSRTLNAGASFTLRATLMPDTAADFVHWVSADPRIASVNANGRVTANASGQVRITAHTDNDRRRTATITVR